MLLDARKDMIPVQISNMAGNWLDHWGSSTVNLERGQFCVKIRARGDEAQQVQAHMRVSFNNDTIGETYVSDSREEYSYPVLATDGPNILLIEHTNDYWNPDTREDRNLLIDSVFFIRCD